MIIKQMKMREEWRFAIRGSGVLYVTIHGTIVMLRLYADSLDLELIVRKIIFILHVKLAIIMMKNSVFDFYNDFISVAVAHTGRRYGTSKNPVFLDNTGCLGSENNLTECSRNRFGIVSSNCKSNTKYASVYCGSKFYTINNIIYQN